MRVLVAARGRDWEAVGEPLQDREGGSEVPGDVASRIAVGDGVGAGVGGRERMVDAGDGFVGRGLPFAVSFTDRDRGGRVAARARGGGVVIAVLLRWAI
ncbi:hypothetical protein, partial [Agrococcus sp. KRD186]|uniref:hypothetical protein n=1 Tax=Agrococcus sp. KRD186 TaxID=2729730 RepID=UPI0019D22FC2